MSKQFELLAWAHSIPLCDDLWLSMHAQNVAMVDQTIIRGIEKRVVDEYFKEDHVPMDLFLPLAALSQMWVFSLYEFLRTWRQRAKEFIKLGEQYQGTKKAERKSFLESAIAKAKKREKLIHAAPTFYTDQVSRIGDPAFIELLKDYFDRTDDLFRRTETVRMPLAKHEVAKTGNQPLAAEAPTYARMSYSTGSVYWFCVLKDNNVRQRRSAGTGR